jgi:hypothetical protein
MTGQGSRSFCEQKEPKKLHPFAGIDTMPTPPSTTGQMGKVFLLLFVHKKKAFLPC